jgi:membrane protein DedA with SNARE-associated domain/rhodanese-related sulfurtransferase
MDITETTRAVQQNIVWVAFVNVLLQQLGFPIPAVPTLLVIGSLIALPSTALLALTAAIAGSLIADAVWYGAGRLFGYRVLSGLCTLSINPGSCVSKTETRFIRWGVWSLVIAKFIPGFSVVAPPVAGSLKMPLPSFLVAAGLGAALWAGLAIGAGWIFRAELQSVLRPLSEHGSGLVVVVATVAAIWILWKLWQKYRFEKLTRMPHITVDELLPLLRSDAPPLLLDFRGHTLRAETGNMRGARLADYDRLNEAVLDWPTDALIVTVCACPKGAGAVQAARSIRALGYVNVKPLQGGFDAWQAAAN